MNLIEMKKINKMYNQGKRNAFHALKNIDFFVDEGDFVAIKGSSGAGKSTLLHIIGCLDTQTTGTYSFCGVCVEEMNQQQKAILRNREIGFVLQDFGLLEYQTVIESVSLPILFSNEVSILKCQSRCLSVLGEVGLQGYAHKKVRELSGGEKQRVAIARALINKPKLIVADEPTGALDEENATLIMNYLRKLNEAGTTIVIVTHDSTVADLCKTKYTMRYGEIRLEKTSVSN